MYTDEQNSSVFFNHTHIRNHYKFNAKKTKQTKKNKNKKQYMSTVNRKNIRFSEKKYHVSFLTVSDNAH